jgi:hypothetical protein
METTVTSNTTPTPDGAQLDAWQTSGTSPPSIEPWMTVVVAARYLGYDCPDDRAPNSVYAILADIGYKINGRWLTRREDLDAWIRGHRDAA